MAAAWPLTGRAEELSLISGLVNRQDGPAGVVLAGAAGVGKTRLAREALAEAEQRGALIRWAAATASARALPLGVFVATLGVVGPDPARLVRQATDALLAGAGRAGVIVGVDDAHLLDELPAMLVHVPARFIGWNRHGPRVWFSSCQVRVADPGAEFVFDVSALGFPVAR